MSSSTPNMFLVTELSQLERPRSTVVVPIMALPITSLTANCAPSAPQWTKAEKRALVPIEIGRLSSDISAASTRR